MYKDGSTSDNRDYSIDDIIGVLKKYNIRYEYKGDRSLRFRGFCPLNQLEDHSITWVRNAKDTPVEELNRHEAVVLMAELGESIEGITAEVVYAENVHRSFFRVVSELYASKDPENRLPQIADSSTVLTTQIGSDVFIGHNCFIDKDVVIGDGVTILHNVTIQGRVTIGAHTVIESGSVIGACGYGHYYDENGDPVCVPHFGGVIIGKHVKIGANNSVSRGCLADTVIEDYVKTDNNCHIAHNDHLKYGAMLTAGVTLSGSTTIGEHAWLAPGSVINNAINVGDNTFIGLGTVVTKDVQDNVVVVGVPARILRENKK